MVLHNPNNWHWVDKNCVEWSRQYFQEHLVGTNATSAVSGKEVNVEITKVSKVDGDCDVSQRKGKVISVFDLSLGLDFSGNVKVESDDSNIDITGNIKVPEVAYDTEEDEYVFEITITSDNGSKDIARTLIKKEIVPQLRRKLFQFGKDLITTHAKDIQHPAEQVTSSFTLGAYKKPETESTKAKDEAKSEKIVGTAAYNTTSLKFEPVFNTSADHLYRAFIDPAMVSAWSRSAAQIKPEEGSEFSLFGGNIQGKILKLDQNKFIEMTWRLRDWKQGHFTNLKLNFVQGSSDTKIKVDWTGIPVGQEEVARNNFEEYYVKSIKVTFGFGVVL
ncbi:Co-chaperone that binds to Hsp82p and activates its ATPase activity [Nadsonia fulvescens var. elongata DSM 6958]|uniref:Co-chaperone that binds to Hsp82p and activates its ATPase activity n=1 Tax=Nadsonia fulvescens var. elongata DSM 6958 TaxID=857566 RepID=A0A1E3PR52_9ASCO|nr:Co-chaperone that binds to Hsp82p and activates its ATPase activity [Nadsonia fulvescens var. elongata DSM 6958]